MPKFLSHIGAIGICGRCQTKVPYTELRMDGNIQGLYVCQKDGCWDPINDFRKPPRKPDNYLLQHPRPDVPISTIPNLLGIGDYYLITNDTGDYLAV